MNSLLPPNASAGERAIEAATARLGDVSVPLRQLRNPDTCPLPLLPWLAWELSIDAWKSYWPAPVKRERVRKAIEIQRHKGTAKSVRDVVRSFGGAIQLREWWETTPRGVPHTFQVWLTLSGLSGDITSAQFTDDVIAEITRTKTVRSHFTLTQGVAASARIGLAGVARAAVYRHISLQEAA